MEERWAGEGTESTGWVCEIWDCCCRNGGGGGAGSQEGCAEDVAGEHLFVIVLLNNLTGVEIVEL